MLTAGPVEFGDVNDFTCIVKDDPDLNDVVSNGYAQLLELLEQKICSFADKLYVPK